MSDSRTWAQKALDEPGAFCRPEARGAQKNGRTRRPRAQGSTQKAPGDRAWYNLSSNIKYIALSYNLEYKTSQSPC